MNVIMKELLVQSDLVSVLLNFNCFQLKKKYIYKTFANTCIWIKIL